MRRDLLWWTLMNNQINQENIVEIPKPDINTDFQDENQDWDKKGLD